MLGLALIIFIFSLFLTKFLGKELVPQEDQSLFIVRLEAPMDYSVQKCDEIFHKAEEAVGGIPEVSSLFYSMGGGKSAQINRGFMFVNLKPKADRKRSQQQIMVDVRKKIQLVPGLKGTAEYVSLIGGGVRNVPIQYSIRGADLNALKGYSKEIMAELSKLPGIVDIDSSLESGKPELKVEIDRDKAADLGVSISAIAEAVNILISGELDITKYKELAKGRRYDVRVRLNPADRMNPDDLGRLYVKSKDGRLIELSNLITIREGGGPNVINRVDRQRAITLFANLEVKPLGQAMSELNAISSRILPADYIPKYKGAADTMGESFKYLTFALILITGDLIKMIWGVQNRRIVLPIEPVAVFDSFINPYLFVIIVMGALVAAFLWWFLARARTGKIVRAAVYSRDMVSALGIPIPAIYAMVFGLGVGIAGLSAGIFLPIIPISLGLDMDLIIQCFAVVVIGGFGSIAGTFVASLLVGMVYSFSILVWPDGALAVIFVILVAVLIWRPWGLFGTEIRS